jgi:hypothetical protein
MRPTLPGTSVRTRHSQDPPPPPHAHIHNPHHRTHAHTPPTPAIHTHLPTRPHTHTHTFPTTTFPTTFHPHPHSHPHPRTQIQTVRGPLVLVGFEGAEKLADELGPEVIEREPQEYFVTESRKRQLATAKKYNCVMQDFGASSCACYFLARQCTRVPIIPRSCLARSYLSLLLIPDPSHPYSCRPHHAHTHSISNKCSGRPCCESR